MQYTYTTNTMGHITITRLSDGATRYLQAQDDVEAFQDVQAGCDKLGSAGGVIMQVYCFTYFEGGE